MERREFLAGTGSAAVFACSLQAFARMGVLLTHAEPCVGLTVTGPVRELRLYFDACSPTLRASRSEIPPVSLFKQRDQSAILRTNKW
jgi:hypothetical protein